MKYLAVMILMTCANLSIAQITATTSDGRVVLLFNDSTWRYLEVELTEDEKARALEAALREKQRTVENAIKSGTDGRDHGTVYQGPENSGTLELNGWEWDHMPKPTLSNETGRIVFIIKVDENGELMSFEKESGSMSAAAEKECKAAIERLTFTKKPSAKVPAVSVGRITFVARVQ
jgi:hypothetical protein